MRSAGVVAESENDATQLECIRAVAIALQSWCLLKLSLLQNFDLALKTVSNDAFVKTVRECLSH